MNENEQGLIPPDKFQAGFETYLSSFTYRYGTPQMRRIWSQEQFWGNVRNIWVNVAETQQQAGLVSQEQVDDLKKGLPFLSVERIFQLEKEKTGHDVAAAIYEYSEVAPIGGEILHLGLTSEDVLSNAEIMQIYESLELVRSKLRNTLEAFGQQIDLHKDLVCMGYTHLQAAEPTTMGYRFAKYAQDLLVDLALLDAIKPMVKGKGIKGVVGTSASFEEILQDKPVTPREQEDLIMDKIGIEAATITDQTYPRKFLFLTSNILANIGQSVHRFALDLQVLQSTPIDEVSEPRRKGQIGSSALPHKRNPINAENIDSLTEMLPGQSFSAWVTSAFVTLERTLRDSAGKRSWLPESFLVVDEALARTERVVRGMEVHKNSVKTNMERYAPFCVTEIILARLVKAGMDRKIAHEILVDHSERAVDAKRSGLPNPLQEQILDDDRIVSMLGEESVKRSFENIFSHVGDAPQRCEEFLEKELYPAIAQ